MKSSIAAPSLRNSGFDATAKSFAPVAVSAPRTFSAVPTGTVDFVTTTLKRSQWLPMVVATARTCCRSALPSSPGGVPTAMKTMSPCRTASPISVVKRSRPSAAIRTTSASSPGS